MTRFHSLIKAVLIAAVFFSGPAYAKEEPSTAATPGYEEQRLRDFTQHIGDLVRQNEKDAAIKELKEAIGKQRFSEPYVPYLYTQLASLYSSVMKDPKNAEEHYGTALSKITDETYNGKKLKMKVLTDIAILQDNRGEPETAAQNFIASLALSKELGEIEMTLKNLTDLVILYMNEENVEEMDRYFHELETLLEPYGGLEKSTKSAANYNFLANVKLVEKKYDEALKYSLMGSGKSLLASGADQASNFDTLASIYLGKKDYEKALVYSKQSLASPNDSPLSRGAQYKTYGDILLGLDRKDEACKAWKSSADNFKAARNSRKGSEVEARIREHCS